jgi:DNA polymerase III delta prime subunit
MVAKNNKHNKEKKELHHANLIIGNRESAMLWLRHLLHEEYNVSLGADNNLWVCDTKTISIKDARYLSERETRKAYNGGVSARKFFIISADSITHEAQNAFLKTLEEPTLNTHFFLIFPRANGLLPTLLSRLEHFDAPYIRKDREVSHHNLGREFLSALPGARIEKIKKTEALKDREYAEELFSSIESIIYNLKNNGAWQKRDQVALNDIMQARRYLHQTSSSPKMLLEYLALALAVYKFDN